MRTLSDGLFIGYFTTRVLKLIKANIHNLGDLVEFAAKGSEILIGLKVLTKAEAHALNQAYYAKRNHTQFPDLNPIVKNTLTRDNPFSELERAEVKGISRAITPLERTGFQTIGDLLDFIEELTEEALLAMHLLGPKGLQRLSEAYYKLTNEDLFSVNSAYHHLYDDTVPLDSVQQLKTETKQP